MNATVSFCEIMTREGSLFSRSVEVVAQDPTLILPFILVPLSIIVIGIVNGNLSKASKSYWQVGIIATLTSLLAFIISLGMLGGC